MRTIGYRILLMVLLVVALAGGACYWYFCTKQTEQPKEGTLVKIRYEEQVL